MDVTRLSTVWLMRSVPEQVVMPGVSAVVSGVYLCDNKRLQEPVIYLWRDVYQTALALGSVASLVRFTHAVVGVIFGMIKNIVIVGGGTAGWLTAGILAASKRPTRQAISLTLVESPDVAPIGVGEGTWPTMRSTLKQIGISEFEFINACSASFKQGSKFVGWKTGGPQDFYYHPFTLPIGVGESAISSVWKQHFSRLRFDEIANIQAQVCELGLAPKQVATPEYAGVLNYGYHLDAGKFAELLREHCTQKLGVKHIKDHVTQVHGDVTENIEAIELARHGRLSGDLFIDCSGTHCLLLGEHYGVAFTDCSRFSINDRALAVQVPYAEENTAIASATIATAQTAGWVWDIGLSSRRGLGYVYSSSHSDVDQAYTHLREYLRKTTPAVSPDNLSFRELTIQAGYRQKFWHKNCVAVGMAAGFIEPLEASALALVELSVKMIRDELPQSAEAMAVVEKRYNEVFHYRWQRIIEFLKLHYLLSDRKDSDYWHDVRSEAGIPENLRESLILWRDRPPYERDLLHTEEVFPAASYAYVLYGMEFNAAANSLCSGDMPATKAIAAVQDEQARMKKYMANIPSNRHLLDAVASHSLAVV